MAKDSRVEEKSGMTARSAKGIAGVALLYDNCQHPPGVTQIALHKARLLPAEPLLARTATLRGRYYHSHFTNVKKTGTSFALKKHE